MAAVASVPLVRYGLTEYKTALFAAVGTYSYTFRLLMRQYQAYFFYKYQVESAMQRSNSTNGAGTLIYLGPSKPFLFRPILPNFSVLARACLLECGVLTSPRA